MQELVNLLKDLNSFINNNNLDEFLSKQLNLESEVTTLKNTLTLVQKECTDIQAQSIKSIQDKDKIIKTLEDELASYKKNSILATMNRQLKEKNEYITILEQQIRIYKNKLEHVSEKELSIGYTIDTNIQSDIASQSDSPKISTTLTEVIEVLKPELNTESALEKTEESIMGDPKQKKKTKKKKLDGYEKIEHKQITYLKNIETNELFACQDDNIGILVGRINSKGKVRLN